MIISVFLFLTIIGVSFTYAIFKVLFSKNNYYD